MMILITIAGGVALILFGVRFVRKGLDRLFGPRLGLWMQRIAGSRWRACLTGLGIAVAAPSSTTVSVLAVQAVRSGQMTPRQMLVVVLGANVGLTLLVLLGALRIEQYALLLVLVGVVLFQFTRGVRSRGIGQILLGLGFIFLSIGSIKTASAAIDPEGDLVHLIRIAQHYPVGLAIVAAVMAVAMQSSTGTILLILGLGSAGVVGLPLVLAVVAGANVGIASTTLGLGWDNPDARRLALGNLLLKGVVAVGVMAAPGPLAALLEDVPGTFELRVGYANTGFNLVVALLGLPLVEPLTRLLERLVPRRADEPEPFGPRYLDDVAAGSVALALGQSQREVLRVGEMVRDMLDDLWRALREHDLELAYAVSRRDDQIDLLDAAIKRFLTRLAGEGLDRAEAAEQMRQLRYLIELETIGDTIDKNLSELVIKIIRQSLVFSQSGWEELEDFYRRVQRNMLIAETAFHTRDEDLARKLLRHKERLNVLQRELRDRHLARLNAGLRESHDTSAVHLDLLTHLKRINSCVSHIAYAVLGETAEPERVDGAEA